MSAALRHGIVVPAGPPARLLELAVIAESAGWDAFVLTEVGYGVDPWTVLAAAAVRTERLRLGTMLTPLPWRRPWKLASQVATLDQLTDGRAILGIGLGAPHPALGRFGEPLNVRTRAELLDDGIDVLSGLWRGERRITGRHVDVDLTEATALGDLLRPAQARPPIWCVAAWPSARSMRRILRCDGLIPSTLTDTGPRQSTPSELVEMLAWLAAEGGSPVDVVVEGTSDSTGSARLGGLARRGSDVVARDKLGRPERRLDHRRVAAGPAG